MLRETGRLLEANLNVLLELKWVVNLKKSEKGNVMIEASIVLSITIVFITALIYLGMYIYHQTNMQVIANETASNIAQVYASTYKDPIYGYVSESEFYKTNLYRNLTNIFTKTLDNTNKKKGEWFAYYRLKKWQMLKNTTPNVEVDITHKKGTLVRQQVIVKIKDTISIPLTRVWGGTSKATVEVEGRADCLDLVDYINLVDTACDWVSKPLIDDAAETVAQFKEWLDFYKKTSALFKKKEEG